MSAIILDEGLVHYEVLGRGRPLVFLHGWLGSWRYWMPTMDNLSDRFRTYAFDMWGFGDSDRNPQRYSLDAYVAQLDLFMEELGVMKASLVGHSMGAAVALLFAERYPGSRRSDHGGQHAVGRRGSEQAAAHGRRRVTARSDVGPPRRIRLSRGRNGSHQDRSERRGRPLPDRWIRSICAMRWMNWTVCRRLLVYGNKDPFVTPLTNDDLRDLDGYVRPIGLNDSGHFPMLDEASKFQRLLRDFLDARPEDLSALALKEEWRRRMH